MQPVCNLKAGKLYNIPLEHIFKVFQARIAHFLDQIDGLGRVVAVL